MSPRRRHPGGRPRSAASVLDLAERWQISEKSARKLAGRGLSDEAMSVLVAQIQRYRAAQMGRVAPQNRFAGGMRALGMRSRVPALRGRQGEGRCRD
jgi:hypothetical protein